MTKHEGENLYPEYKGCSNCRNQIAPLRACKWLEHGGDGVVHIICPRWEERTEREEE